MSRIRRRLRLWGERPQIPSELPGPPPTEEDFDEVPVAQALPRWPDAYVDFRPMDQWSPAEVDAHLAFMGDFAARLEGTGDRRALELAGELSAAPGPGGKPIHEWLELRPFLSFAPTVTD